MNLDYHIKVTFLIHKIKYLILKNALSEIPEIISIIDSNYEDLTTLNKFYYLKHKGNYYYIINELQSSETSLEKAIECLSALKITEQNEASLYYLYSLCLSKNLKNSKAIEYAEMSLKIFQSGYQSEACISCHILLGICYRRFYNIEKSLKHYHEAKRLSETHGLLELQSLSEHNLAYLISKIGNHKAAIKHYLRSYHLKKISNQDLIHTIVALVEEYYEISDIKSCSKWITEGFDYLRKDSIKKENNKLYYYCLKYYKFGFFIAVKRHSS